MKIETIPSEHKNFECYIKINTKGFQKYLKEKTGVKGDILISDYTNEDESFILRVRKSKGSDSKGSD